MTDSHQQNVRSLWIRCGALDCHHDAVIDVSAFPDDAAARPRELAEVVAQRLPAALERRLALDLPRDAYRVVHAEGDGLPGLIVDRYADAAVVQTTSAAMNAARDQVLEVVRAVLQPRVLVVRDDGSARDFEELPRFAALVSGAEARVVYRLGKNRLRDKLHVLSQLCQDGRLLLGAVAGKRRLGHLPILTPWTTEKLVEASDLLMPRRGNVVPPL